MNGYWPAYFPQRSITRDEGSIVEKTFREMTFSECRCFTSVWIFENI